MNIEIYDASFREVSEESEHLGELAQAYSAEASGTGGHSLSYVGWDNGDSYVVAYLPDDMINPCRRRPIGYIAYSLGGGGEIHLNEVVVDQQYRGNGVATEMIEYLYQSCKPNFTRVVFPIKPENFAWTALISSRSRKNTGVYWEYR